MSEVELKEKGIEVLVQALGPVDGMRFVNLLSRGTLDYTEWRAQQPDDLSLEELSSKAMEAHERKKQRRR